MRYRASKREFLSAVLTSLAILTFQQPLLSVPANGPPQRRQERGTVPAEWGRLQPAEGFSPINAKSEAGGLKPAAQWNSMAARLPHFNFPECQAEIAHIGAGAERAADFNLHLHRRLPDDTIRQRKCQLEIAAERNRLRR